VGDKYISDHTKFIAEMKRKNPQVEEGQIKGRAILWDKSIDLEAAKRYRDAQVPQPAYVYQNYVGGPPPGSSGSGS
jgi:hypothetical protein